MKTIFIRYLTFLILVFFYFSVSAQKAKLIIPKGHTTPVVLLDFHDDLFWLASSQGNNAITIWNYHAEKEIRQVENHEARISSLKFHPDNALIYSGDIDGRLIVTDIIRSRKRSDLKAHDKKINQIEFSPGYDFIATASDDGIVKIFDAVKMINVFESDLGEAVKSVVFKSDTLFAGTIRGRIFKIVNQEVTGSFSAENAQELIRINKYRDILILIYKNGYVEKYNYIEKKSIAGVQLEIKVKDAQLLKDEELLIVGRGEKEIVKLNLESFKVKNDSIADLLQKNLDPYDIALQTISAYNDSSTVFIPDYDYSIIAYDQKKSKIIKRFSGFTERIRKLSIHPNSEFMAIASNSNGIRIYDLKEIAEKKQIETESQAFSTSFSPEGTKIALATRNQLLEYSFPDLVLLKKINLKGTYPNGNLEYLTNELLIKKDQKDGLDIFNLKSDQKELLKIKEAFEFSINRKQNRLAVKSGKDRIYLYEFPKFKRKKKIRSEGILDFEFNLPSSNIWVLKTESNKQIIELIDEKGKIQNSIDISDLPEFNKFQKLPNRNLGLFWNTATKKGSSEQDLKMYCVNLIEGEIINEFEGIQSTISAVEFYERQNLVLAASNDGTIKVWPLEKDTSLQLGFPASIVPLEDKELVTIMKNGVYDATRGAFQQMHYVQGREYVSLDQLKSQYYEPFVLSKIFNYNDEGIRATGALEKIDLYPEIELQHPNINGGNLGIDLKARGGGIGDVYIWINGKKASEIQYASKNDDHIEFDVSGHPFLIPHEINKISVSATNEKGDVVSQKKDLRYIWNEDIESDEPKFYAMIVGVSDYEGNRLDLEFASKDALDIASALQKGAGNYFGSRNVQITSLNTSGDAIKPTKQNIVSALSQLSDKIKPQDVFMFYFAGHGVKGEGEDQKFYILGSNASKKNSQDFSKYDEIAISDTELGELFGKIPSHKMIMILDACHSGSLISNLNNTKEHLSSKEVRALESLMDETGMYILAGSESDRVSYETSLYGQGLLTYSLLFGIKGEALREGEYLDVNELFRFAARNVPQLASRIGGVQRPEVKLPSHAKNIDIGRYGAEEKEQINLVTPRPVVLNSSFQDNELFLDILNIGLNLDNKIKEEVLASDMDFVFLKNSNYTGAYDIRGRYQKQNKGIILEIRIFKGYELIDKEEFIEKDLGKLLDKVRQHCVNTIDTDFKKSD